MISIPALAGVLVALWCNAASAATYEEHCSRRALANGAVGEQVVTCELTRVPSTIETVVKPRITASSRRSGNTTVAHYGTRPGKVALD